MWCMEFGLLLGIVLERLDKLELNSVSDVSMISISKETGFYILAIFAFYVGRKYICVAIYIYSKYK